MNELDTSQVQDHSSLLSSLRALQDNPGWKYIASLRQGIIDDIEEKILEGNWTFIENEIMKDRRKTMKLMLSTPEVNIKDYETAVFALKENSKPLSQRIEEHGENFSKELKKRGIVK